MKFGHRGGNHPVKDLATGKIEITEPEPQLRRRRRLASTAPGLQLTHVNLLDGTVEGVECADDASSRAVSPESASGPQDSALFVRQVHQNDGGERRQCLRERIYKKVLVIGSGPIVIGQAAEFDYAGTQACLALQGGGLRGRSWSTPTPRRS
ncbi:MAG: hypothetical protein ACLUFW_10835 [Alistipes sp.]